MKRKFNVFVFIFLFFQLIGFSQELELNDKIKIIRDNFKMVNDNWMNYEKTKIDVMESAEGGEITYYSKNNLIVKISEMHYGETGKAQIDSYYINEKLSFVFVQNFRYNAHIMWTEEREEDGIVYPAFDPNKTKVFEDRFYFYENEMIRWINSDKDFVDKELEEFKEEEENRLKRGKELIEKIKNQ